MKDSTNISCKHRQLVKSIVNTERDFCRKCGCILVIKNGKYKEVESFSILLRKFISPLETFPQDTIRLMKAELEKSSLSKYFSKIPESYVEKRKELIEMLKDYFFEYKFSSRGYFLGVYLLDFIFIASSYPTSELKTDILVLAVFLVSIKYIEDNVCPPILSSFPNKKNMNLLYPVNEVRKYEVIVMQLADYKLNVFTSIYLTEAILSQGVTFSHEFKRMNIVDSKGIKDKLKKLNRLAIDINKMFIENIDSIQFNALEIALTSINLSKELMKFDEQLGKELESLYGVDTINLASCYDAIIQ